MEVGKFVELELGIYFAGIIGFVKKKTQHPDQKVPSGAYQTANGIIIIIIKLV